MGREARRRAEQKTGLSVESLLFRAAEQFVRPHTGDIRGYLAAWARAADREMCEGVVFFGRRSELVRFFPAELLPVTHHPLAMVVAGDELAQVLGVLGQAHCDEICATVTAPVTDGGIRVLVLLPDTNKIVLVRIYSPNGAA